MGIISLSTHVGLTVCVGLKNFPALSVRTITADLSELQKCNIHRILALEALGSAVHESLQTVMVDAESGAKSAQC